MTRVNQVLGWGSGALVVFAALVALSGVLRLPSVPTPVEKAADRSLVLSTVRQDDVLRDQLTLYDPTPLFLPTPVNITERVLPVRVRREPGAQLRPFEPVFVFPREAVALQFPESVEIPSKPADGLSVGGGRDLFLGIGVADLDLAPLTKRLGFLEAVELKTGKTVLATPLEGSGDPLKADWGELKLQGAISPLGLIGQLTLISGSGSGEADDFFRNYLAKVFRVGERLPPGFYRFRVGP